MTCETIRLSDGTTGIVCTRGRRRLPKCSVKGCRDEGVYQCDAPAPRKKSGTCDKHLCGEHRVSVRQGVDYCAEHAADLLCEDLVDQAIDSLRREQNRE